MASTPPPYPVQFSVENPGENRNRLTTFLRLILAIPISIVVGLVVWGQDVGSGSLLVFAPLLMILFVRKYPKWWFDWNVAALKFANRLWVYQLLLRDEYPSTDDEQAVVLEIPYPDAQNDLNRWLPLVKWLLAVPHYIVLLFLHLAVFVVVVISWFFILFTGRYPGGFYYFVEGVVRWTNRVIAYAFILTTDQYPPFRLGP